MGKLGSKNLLATKISLLLYKHLFVGTWCEPVSYVIDLAFSVENATVVIAEGIKEKSERKYTHRDITYWCQRFWEEFYDIEDAPKEIENIIDILNDVDCQWDLYLANTYKLEELQSLELDEVELPTEWFEEWLEQLKAEQGVGDEAL